MHLKLFDVKYQVCKYLSEEHECVVGSEVLGEELNTVTLQSRDGVLLRRVQSRHHSLRTDVDLVRIQEPEERKTEQSENSGLHVVCRMNQKGLATIFDTQASLKKREFIAQSVFLNFSGTCCLKTGIKCLVRFIVLFSSSLITERLSCIKHLLIIVCISLGSTLRYRQMSYHCPKNLYNINWNETSSS